jgi:hypothetical protein
MKLKIVGDQIHKECVWTWEYIINLKDGGSAGASSWRLVVNLVVN